MMRTIPAITIMAILSLAAPAMTSQSQNPQAVEKVQDPVCKLMVRKDPELSVQHAGATYYFCMRADMVAFEKDPHKYLGPEHTH